MIRYYKLFDLLNRLGMKKSDLRQILSSSTVAKLSKGEYISGEAIEKICKFLHCQPGDIMEYIEEEQIDNYIHEIVPMLLGDSESFRPMDEPPINDYRLSKEFHKTMKPED